MEQIEVDQQSEPLSKKTHIKEEQKVFNDSAQREE